MKRDVEKALEYFDGIIDKNNWVMNYPYGNYSDDVIQYIESRNCKLGLSVEAKMAELGVDNRFALPRWDTNDLPPKGDRAIQHLKKCP